MGQTAGLAADHSFSDRLLGGTRRLTKVMPTMTGRHFKLRRAFELNNLGKNSSELLADRNFKINLASSNFA